MLCKPSIFNLEQVVARNKVRFEIFPDPQINDISLYLASLAWLGNGSDVKIPTFCCGGSKMIVKPRISNRKDVP